MGMVYQHSIPFGSPSQFRLQMTVTADGHADMAVLDAFNQPIGNLNHMRAALSEVAKLTQPGAEPVRAEGNHSHIVLTRTDDPDWLKVFYADEEAFMERETTVMLEEVAALIEDAKASVG
ncbi:MAG TPA: hypothetical protein PLX06_07965 [Fimbriimonadaceae bacterium]|nr:hypothetical protein [Fimbriimonadaceae bacterium]